MGHHRKWAVFIVLGLKPRGSHVLGKHCATELCPHSKVLKRTSYSNSRAGKYPAPTVLRENVSPCFQPLSPAGLSSFPVSSQLPGGTHAGAPDAVPGLCVPAPEGPHACAAAGPGPAGGGGEVLLLLAAWTGGGLLPLMTRSLHLPCSV